MPNPGPALDPTVRDLLTQLAAEFERLGAGFRSLQAENERLRNLVARDRNDTAEGNVAGDSISFKLQESPLIAARETQSVVPAVPSTGAEAVDRAQAPKAALGGAGPGGMSPLGALRAPGTIASQASPPDPASRSASRSKSRIAAFDHKAETAHKVFTGLCGPESSTLPAEELLALRNQMRGIQDIDPAELEQWRAAADALATAAGITAPSGEFTEGSFMLLSENDLEGLAQLVSAEASLATLQEMKAVLVRSGHARCVAEATNLSIGKVAQSQGRHCTVDRLMAWVDPIVGVIVIINSIVMGLKCDYAKDWSGWDHLEALFTWIFVFEFLLKVSVKGFVKIFFQEDALFNCFDCAVTLAALVNFIIDYGDLGNGGSHSVTLLRLLRFLRFARLVKVLRLNFFKELSLMLTGIMMGMRTLLWAVVCLFYFVYALGVVLTQVMGQDGDGSRLCQDPSTCSYFESQLDQERRELFGTVPRSMFTVYRCYTEGCSSLGGAPLGPFLFSTYGHIAVILYVGISVFVHFGLFNLIAAIFIHNTLENAKEDEERRRELQEAYKIELAHQMQRIMVAFCRGGTPAPRKKKRGNFLCRMLYSALGSEEYTPEMDMDGGTDEITPEMFYHALEHEDVQHILDELEVQKTNRRGLFEVLDADGSGSLEVSELVRGLMKLRSGGEKNDVVALLLAVQALRKSVRTVEEFCERLDPDVTDILGKVSSVESKVAELTAAGPLAAAPARGFPATRVAAC